MTGRFMLVAASATVLLQTQPISAQPDSDFYAGKTVKVVIGASMGGEYGLYSQLFARHIRKFIPGNPTIIVQSMPGGGGMNAINYVANIAPQDGTVLSLPHVNIVQDGMLNPKMRFDPRTFQWIGRLREQFQVGVVSKKSGVNSIAGAKSKALIAGATAANSPTALNPRILNLLAGTKFKIVSGYRGTDEIAIAWERGEVDVLTTGWDNIVRRYGDRLKAGLIHPIYVYGTRRVSELGQVPVISEFGRTADETAFLRIYTIGTEIGRALAAPPNVPKERIQMWRMAFEKMLGDPDFQKTTRQGEVWINSLKGEELAAKVADVTALPSEQVTKARQFYDQLQATGR